MKTMSKSRIITGCLCAVLAGMLPQTTNAQTKQYSAAEIAKMKPSGTVVLDEKEIALIFGGSEGKGVLTFQGKQYPFTVKGLSAGASIGIVKVHAAGNVYQLNKVEDFAGKYTLASAGATAVKGAGKGSYQNTNGVYMSLTQKATGAELELGIGFIDVKMAK